MNDGVTRRSALGIVAGFLMQPAAASGNRLFMISASPQPHSDLSFPAVLYCLKLGGAHVAWQATLFPADDGSAFVLYSFESRFAVVGGPKSLEEVVVVSFNRPAMLRKEEIEKGGMTVLGRHVVELDGAPYLGLNLLKRREHRYLALGIASKRQRQVAPAKLFAHLRINGNTGGLIACNDGAGLLLSPNGRELLLAESNPAISTGIRLPPWVRIPPRTVVGLMVATKDLWVVSSGRVRDLPGPAAKRRFYILERAVQRWHSVDIPGGGSQVRAFGQWLAFVPMEIGERNTPSPGRDRRRNAPTATGSPFDWAVETSDVYLPGLMYLYHVPTRTKVVEETGQGDTEVLWVKEGRVLYRCDRQLFEARIDGNKLVHKRKLIERDFIADVHCVFYGPASDPPPDPPWKVTRGEPDF